MNYAPDLTTAAIKMVLSLGVVLLIVWGLFRLAKHKLPLNVVGSGHKLIQIVDSQCVGVKKSVAMVQIPGSILVLGIGAENVNLLTQIQDPDIIKDIHASPKKQSVLSFKSHLHRLTQSHSSVRKDTRNEKVVD